MSNKITHFDTIVIGAGISGLACASRLLQQRAQAGTLLVLEARDRIGGRIGSVYVNGYRLDTGANWIHGIGTKDHPNPLMDILPHKRYKQLSGMVTFRPPEAPKYTKLRSDEESHGWINVPNHSTPSASVSGESLVVPSDSAEVLQNALWGTIESIHETAAEASPTEAKLTSVLSAIKKMDVLQESFRELPDTYHPALGGMLQFMEPMEAAPLAAQSAEHRLDFPGMSLLEFAINDFEGDQVFLQDGYIAIINEVAKDLLEAGVVQTGKEVVRIDWQSDLISVTTTSGDSYTAKNVVCTLPLGVLKQRQHGYESTTTSQTALFNPELPQDKIQAIAALGFGTLDKIFLVYSKAWWTEEPFASIIKRGYTKRPFTRDTGTNDELDNLQEPDAFAAFTYELPGIQIHQNGDVTTGPRLISLTNINSLSGFPVLCAFVSCANAVHVERLADVDAAGIVHRALSSSFGQQPPKPQKIHVTRWATDPYSLGSYSHMITGLSETGHREAFQQPVTNEKGGKLRFAGEHTSRNHFATVHGALLSGWREADGILSESWHPTFAT